MNTGEHADGLLALVLEGTKVATASSVRDYADKEEPLLAVGGLSITLDRAGRPCAVLEVTAIDFVPLDQVSAERADAEGEGDRTLASWRRIQGQFWTEHYTELRPGHAVVCERFRVLAAPSASRG